MNSSIVIALPKIEDAKKIRAILIRYGFSVASVCSTGAGALASMSELDGGVLNLWLPFAGYVLPGYIGISAFLFSAVAACISQSDQRGAIFRLICGNAYESQ